MSPFIVPILLMVDVEWLLTPHHQERPAADGEVSGERCQASGETPAGFVGPPPAAFRMAGAGPQWSW